MYVFTRHRARWYNDTIIENDASPDLNYFKDRSDRISECYNDNACTKTHDHPLPDAIL